VAVIWRDFNFTEEREAPPSSPFNFDFIIEGQYNVLKGTSNNFIAIWADATAGLSTGKFYVASRDTLNIIDLENEEVCDYYTQTHGGRANEVLDSDDIEDINIA